jgi:LPS sulfotransferase NodH
VSVQDLSWIGIWLLVFSAVIIVIELAIAGIWSARLARRAQRLSAELATEQRGIKADVERLRAAMAETVVLWQPYRRVLRYLRHPLVVAVIQSYARRRAG